ncbi:MAG: hypothetical protein E6Y83_17115 [Clostridium butyricum]|nr:hypothetical protein [Clostridium butyricum]
MSAKKNATTITKTNKVVIYIGPTIPGVATKNMVLNNGLTQSLKDAITETPIIEKLLVEPKDLSSAVNQINNKDGAIYTFYNKVLNYRDKKGDY